MRIEMSDGQLLLCRQERSSEIRDEDEVTRLGTPCDDKLLPSRDQTYEKIRPEAKFVACFAGPPDSG
jgi:hypothetical protein